MCIENKSHVTLVSTFLGQPAQVLLSVSSTELFLCHNLCTVGSLTDNMDNIINLNQDFFSKTWLNPPHISLIQYLRAV